MAKQQTKFDGRLLADACELADVRTTDRETVLGVSASTFRAACRDNGNASVKSLLTMVGCLLDRVAGSDAAATVYSLLQKLAEGQDVPLDKVRLEVSRRGRGLLPTNSLPAVTDLLARRGTPIDEAIKLSREGDAASANRILDGIEASNDFKVTVLRARVDNWYRNGFYDEAREAAELLLAASPRSPAAALCVVKACLNSRRGDLLKHWRRATELLDRPASNGDADPIDRRFWRAFAITRNPLRIDDLSRFSEAAVEYQAILPEFAVRADRSAEAYVRAQAAAALFRSGKPGNQDRAIEELQKLAVSLKGPVTAYIRATALKFLGNCLALRASRPNAVSQIENLREAVRHYDAACRYFLKSGRWIEWAQSRYSQADAFVTIATTVSRQQQSWFSKAKTACDEAIERLPPEFAGDWGRAVFNLADCYHRWPRKTDQEKDADLVRAIDLYNQCLTAFPRTYILEEWCDTHIPLANAYRQLAELRQNDCNLLALAIASMKAAVTVRPTFRDKLLELKSLYERRRCENATAFDSIAMAS